MSEISRTAVLSNTRRNPGIYLPSAISIPNGTHRVGLVIQRTNWDVTVNDLLNASIEVSEDNVRWQPLGSITAKAGSKLKKDGTPLTETSAMFPLPRENSFAFVRLRVECVARFAGEVSIVFDDEQRPARSQQIHNSVTYDNDAENTAGGVTSLTISSFVVANNANRILLVGIVGWDGTAGDSAVSGVTWNGSATGADVVLTELGPGVAIDRATIWRVLAPTATTANLVISFGGSVAEVGANVISLYDVDQTTPLGTPLSAEAAGTTPASRVIADAANDDMVYDIVYFSAGGTLTAIVGADQTQRVNATISGSTSKYLASTQLGSISGDAMTWDLSSTFDFVGTAEYVQVAVAVKAATGASPKLHMPFVNRKVFQTIKRASVR